MDNRCTFLENIAYFIPWTCVLGVIAARGQLSDGDLEGGVINIATRRQKNGFSCFVQPSSAFAT